MPSALRVARVLHATRAEGPHLRSAIWVQGCSIRCKGCINPHLFTERGGTLREVGDIIAEAQQHEVEGITLIGGEPFDQAAAGADLAEAAQAAGLGVLTFTGYTMESLQNRDPDAARPIDATDLLVDGPYREDEPETERALIGSANQRFIHLSARYEDYDPVWAPNRVDVRIHPDGTVELGGFLDSENLREFSAQSGLLRRRRS